MTADRLLNFAAVAFSLVAIVTSTTTAVRQSKLMEHANLLPVLSDLFGEFRAPEFFSNMQYISHSLWKDFPPSTTQWPDLHEDKTHVRRVAGFFNLVGVLVANGIIGELLVASYMGASVLRAWKYLGPYIQNDRSRRQDPNWFLFFENLAQRIAQYPPARISALLKLEGMPVSPPAP
jgi:Domain of unknown function (DUF4760)